MVKDMPQLAKGGRRTYGWVTIDSVGRLPIPPQAWEDYQFSINDDYVAIPGSCTLGDFAITTRTRLTSSSSITPIGTVSYEWRCCLRLSELLLHLVKMNKSD